METYQFPSVKAAYRFTEEAQESGYNVRIADVPPILPAITRWAILAGALVGGSLAALLGLAAESGYIGLDRLEPLFAAPFLAVTALLAAMGGSLGALIGGFVGLRPAPSRMPGTTPHVQLGGRNGADQQLVALAEQFGGYSDAWIGAKPQPNTAEHDKAMHRLTLMRIAAWLLVVLSAAVLLEAATYIWYLSMAYGPGADQQTRIGYTLKNAQRIPADTPASAGEAMAAIFGGDTLGVTTDPLAAAVLAPLAASRGQTLVYGGGDATVDRAAIRQLAAGADVAVVVADENPAYALPAAYAATYFRVPVIPLSAASEVLDASRDRLILLAAPRSLVGAAQVEALGAFGRVERVADENIYRHALRWARGRWGDFGWGIDETKLHDGYYHFTLANPADPAFAAAGLPMAYRGNFGPLLYTPQDDLDPLTDQYLWRLGPDFFAVPSDGPFVNVRVVGNADSVSYNVQARVDLAVETHPYRNQMAGASGAAVGGWMWFIAGVAGFIWSLFAIPRRLPDVGFYPRLYWPLAMLTLGPLGILAFHLCYRGRPVEWNGHMAAFVRPAWARAVAATIMGMGVGMTLMIAAMYLFELFGMPLWEGLAYTPLYWLGSPMDGLMWFLMVVPAVLLSTLLFMGPMMSEMHNASYWHGVKKALPAVTISMIAASAGMFTLAWWMMNWENQMAGEDLWLWITPLWFGAAAGFLTALVPNYLMVRAGWKEGGM
jgi:hypothetical protein